MTRKRVNPLALTCPIIDTQNLSVSEDDPKTGRPSAICIQGSQAILRPVDDEDVVDFWEDLVASYDYRHSLLYCKTILVISLQGCLWRSFVVTVNHLNFATILRHIISRHSQLTKTILSILMIPTLGSCVAPSRVLWCLIVVRTWRLMLDHRQPSLIFYVSLDLIYQ